ncbi:MAG: rhodanese-like domain-containing protein [Treponema sp.]|nr:rhodanese-like domain-containing protein [Spirochaetia bacterium]MDD7581077.1 rhodanese-like domain-containing protein [Treponema sp.]MDY3759211.1 rhodanese-like domain-containing protein [Treponema sp.]MDY5837882.1 rhodanese-like domain-containing protein [Treponema sp.]
MKIFSRIILPVLMTLSMIPASAQKKETTMAYEQISQKEAKSLMDNNKNIVILDVRTKKEFDEGHIKGAINIPVETIGSIPPAQLRDKKQMILVYCRSGRRSKMAAQKLGTMGYENVLEFGGIMDWGYGTVKDAPKPRK